MALLAGSGSIVLEAFAIELPGYPIDYKPPNLLELLLHNIRNGLELSWHITNIPSVVIIIASYVILITRRRWAKAVLIVILVLCITENILGEVVTLTLFFGLWPLTPFFAITLFLDLAYRGKLRTDKSLMRRWLPLQIIPLGIVLLSLSVFEGLPSSVAGSETRAGLIAGYIATPGYLWLIVVTIWYGIYCCRKKPSPREEG